MNRLKEAKENLLKAQSLIIEHTNNSTEDNTFENIEMLSRVTESIILVGLQIDVIEPKEEVKEDVSEFDKLYNDLERLCNKYNIQLSSGCQGVNVAYPFVRTIIDFNQHVLEYRLQGESIVSVKKNNDIEALKYAIKIIKEEYESKEEETEERRKKQR